MYLSQHTPRPVIVTKFADGAPAQSFEVECRFIVTRSRKTIVGETRVEKHPDGSRVYDQRDYRRRFPTD